MTAIQHLAPPRILTVDLALRLGISRSRVRTEVGRGNWRRLATGIVLTRPDRPTREDWADLGVALAGPGSAITGWDAVRACGLGSRNPPSQRVLVVSPTAMNRVIGDVQIRRTCRPYTSHVQPLGAPFELQPLVGAARAVADTALQCRQDHRTTRALVTSAVQRGACELVDLLAEYRAGPRRHSAGLRLALSDATDGARSVAEAIAAERLACGNVPPFELNVPIVDRHGTVLYVVDILWRELRAVVEIDSREYHFDEDDWTRTLVRHNRLTRLGLALLHYSPRLVDAPKSTFVTDVSDFVAQRATDLGVPLPPGRGVRRPPIGESPRPLIVDA